MLRAAVGLIGFGSPEDFGWDSQDGFEYFGEVIFSAQLMQDWEKFLKSVRILKQFIKKYILLLSNNLRYYHYYVETFLSTFLFYFRATVSGKA